MAVPLLLILIAVTGGRVQAHEGADVLSAARACVADQVQAINDHPDRFDVPLALRLSLKIDGWLGRLSQMDVGPATQLCYFLGTVDHGLIDHWPGRDALYLFYASEDFRDRNDRLKTLVDRGITRTAETFALYPPLTPHVYVGNNLAGLQAEAGFATHRGEPLTGIGDRLDPNCDTPGVAAAYANPVRVVICLPGDAGLYDVAEPRLTETLVRFAAHEFVHTFQMQATGAFLREGAAVDPAFGVPGPAWMMEGLAYYAGARAVQTRAEIQAELDQALTAHGYSAQDICRIRQRQRVTFEAPAGPRAVARAAVMALEDRAGADSFARFYGVLGVTGDWLEAFRRVWGDSPDAVLGCPD